MSEKNNSEINIIYNIDKNKIEIFGYEFVKITKKCVK